MSHSDHNEIPSSEALPTIIHMINPVKQPEKEDNRLDFIREMARTLIKPEIQIPNNEKGRIQFLMSELLGLKSENITLHTFPTNKPDIFKDTTRKEAAIELVNILLAAGKGLDQEKQDRAILLAQAILNLKGFKAAPEESEYTYSKHLGMKERDAKRLAVMNDIENVRREFERQPNGSLLIREAELIAIRNTIEEGRPLGHGWGESKGGRGV